MNDGKQFCQRYKMGGTMLRRKDIIDMFTTPNNRESYLKPICNKIARNKVNPVKKSKTETCWSDDRISEGNPNLSRGERGGLVVYLKFEVIAKTLRSMTL